METSEQRDNAREGRLVIAASDSSTLSKASRFGGIAALTGLGAGMLYTGAVHAYPEIASPQAREIVENYAWPVVKYGAIALGGLAVAGIAAGAIAIKVIINGLVEKMEAED